MGVLRPKDLAPYEIQAEYLRRLCDRGQLKKLGRGSYVPATRKVSFPLSLALVTRAVPHGVICLQSALAFHKLANANAREISVAIERRSEEHTSELQSLMRISYAVFCLNKKTKPTQPMYTRHYVNTLIYSSVQ